MANGLFGGGDGSRRNPYKVEDARDLNALSDGKFYIQGANINLSMDTFIPISLFNGGYDGQGYFIDNLIISDANRYDSALFSNSVESELKNIYLRNVSINGQSGGMLASTVNGGSVTNCHAEGEISCDDVGGFIRHISNNALVKKCSVRGIVAGGSVSGFAGYLFSGAKIEDCYVNGLLVGNELSGNSLAGFIRHIKGPSTVKNSYTSVQMSSIKDSPAIAPFYDTSPSGVIPESINYCYTNTTNLAPLWDITRGYAEGSFVSSRDGTLFKCIKYQHYATYPMGVETPNYEAEPNKGVNSHLYWERYTSNESRVNDEMKQKITFIGWDFDSVWKINNGTSYPDLIRIVKTSTQCTAFPLFQRMIKN